MNDTPNDSKGKEIEEVGEVGPMEGLETLMVVKETTSTVEKKWL